MADTAGRPAVRTRQRLTGLVSALAATGGERPAQTRHPLVAVAMVLPLALLLAVLFGGVEAVVTQASSVAGMLGR
ncbi:hypothetical protein JJV70_19180 [Streptomyces sp. JJ66]|uniref:hypothetical protein n=1 Tax=Streptomyces sp. JJ66 TaxID=2803843 RepID=UPI001C59F247|nr:hypothetical protein [Streptomyces sp. JJ66]MBW1604183.1 hypothetical protein [Streptomyces sp. JJ66]